MTEAEKDHALKISNFGHALFSMDEGDLVEAMMDMWKQCPEKIIDLQVAIDYARGK